ncbi:MAG: FeoA domain-containing protein [Phycisphaerales bacterium]|nr:FeoA domain-containing protein [Phycisphaerales bacterium]
MKKLLSEIPAGSRVKILDIGSNNTLSVKLMELGCMPGEIITLEKIAPLGDPICIKVSGYLLSLRLNEAENIVVEGLNNSITY